MEGITVQASSQSLQVHGNTLYGMTSAGTGYCYGCYTWPCTCNRQYHYHQYNTPVLTYTIASADKAALLKAWLDGFMTDRKMSEKALKAIQKKLEEFCDD